MTWHERVAQVRLHGFTDRQAAFLVTVMLHAGVCVGRQYCAFAGIPYGRKVCDFFASLLTRGYATARPCGHHRARLFHIHHKPLYRAVGEPDHRHRRPTTLPRAIERLMVLDAVLADRDRTWLATEQGKLTYFTLMHRIPRHDLPSLTFRAEEAETVRYFPDKLPIALDRDGRTHVFLYLLIAGPPDRLSRLPGAPRGAPPGAAGVDRAAARPVPQARRDAAVPGRLSGTARVAPPPESRRGPALVLSRAPPSADRRARAI